MFKNHFKIFVRHISRHRSYAAINISGLALGMAASILILIFIQKELSFESMHSDSDRIYRVLTIDKALGTNAQRVGITMPALGPALAPEFPEIEAATRLTFGGQTLLQYGSNPAIYAEELRSADVNFFSVFDYELLRGDPATVLREPFSLVLTETLSKQIFDNEDPMGQSLRDGNGNDLIVTGVLADLPDHTHLTFDALGSIETQISIQRADQPEGSQNPIFFETWRAIAMPTYAKFAPGQSADGFDERITQLTRDNGVRENFDITLQALTDVHLRSTDIIFDPVTNKGDMNNVYVFAAVALLILLIAIVNYMNLATARSTDRAKEVGLRKVVGSGRGQIMGQFLSESFFTTCVAIALSVGVAWLALPWLSDLSGTTLRISSENAVGLGIFLTSMIFIVGLLAGLYPAFVLASFKPITVLNG